MSIRKVVAGLLIAAGIAIMAVPFFWRTTGEKQTEQLISEFEQTLEDDYDEETDVEEEQTSISKEDEAILKEGGVIGIIEIPGLNIRYPVMEGTASKVLNAGIGHIEETAAKYGIPHIAKIPIDPQIAKMCDMGGIEDYQGEWLDDLADVMKGL